MKAQQSQDETRQGHGDVSKLVSIGMPVYNGEDYIGLALDSLRAQDYPNLEIVISDNASTDRTEIICRAAAETDPRIRYHRAAANIGAWGNFRRAFELSRGEYFAWAGHHDLWHPRFASACAEALDRRPGAVLAYPHLRLIDRHGALVDEDHPALDTVGLPTVERLSRMLLTYPVCAVYGLIRADAIRAVTTEHGIGLDRRLRHVSPDVILLLKLARIGGYAVVPQTLSYFRVFGIPWRAKDKLKELDPAQKSSPLLPRVEFLRDVHHVLWTADVSPSERIRLSALLLRTWGWTRTRSFLYDLDVLKIVSRTKRLFGWSTPKRKPSSATPDVVDAPNSTH